jgi:hypothetical protein
MDFCYLSNPSLKQACISEPGRILYGWTRDILGRLLFSRGSGTGTGGEIISDAVKLALAAGEGTAAADEDHIKLWQNKLNDRLIRQLEDEGYYYDEVFGVYTKDENYVDLSDDDDIDRSYPPPPPSMKVPDYDEDGDNTRMAMCNSRRLVELLAVRPFFPFKGTFVAFNDSSGYSCSSQEGQTCCSVDSQVYIHVHIFTFGSPSESFCPIDDIYMYLQGNLILYSGGAGLEDRVCMKIYIPKNDNYRDYDTGYFTYIVDPYMCGIPETHTISVGGSRRISVTCMPMHTAVQSNVYVTFDLISSSGSSIYYVYGEIAACHQLYGHYSVMLFSHGKEDKTEVTDGKLPL